MEFRIDLVENGGAAAGGGNPPNGPSVALTAAELAQLKKQFGDALAQQILHQGTVGGQPVAIPEAKDPNLSIIEKQIVPALASVAPAVATILRAAPKEVEKAEEEQKGPTGSSFDPIAEARKRLEREERMKAIEEAYLDIVGREALPADAAQFAAEQRLERDRQKARENAAYLNLKEGPAEAEAADPAIRGAMRELKSIREEIAEERAYAEMTGGEEPVYDVIDPAEEARQQHLESMNDTLKGGSRIAAQAGMGATGQALFGGADLLMGIATADPIQAAIGGIQLVGAAATAVANVMDTARSAIEFYAGQVEDMAHNRYWKLLDDRFTAVSDVLGKIPVVGDALAATFNLAVAPVRAFHDVVEAFVQRGKELSGFSPELATANAMADVRTLLADIHEADVLGPDLAQLTNSYTDLSMEMRELFLPVKEWIVEQLSVFMLGIVEWMRDARVLISKDFWTELINDLAAAITPNVAGGMSIAEAAAKLGLKFDQLRAALTGADKDPNELMNRLFDIHGNGLGPTILDPVRQGRDRQPRFAPPILAGL